MSTSIARDNMIKQQLRTWGITSEQVIDIFTHIDRTLFVPEAYQQLAYAEIRIPLGHERCMLTPQEQARALEALAIQGTDTILELEAGSGYLTTLLANLSRQVVSIESIPELYTLAKTNLQHQGLENVTLLLEDPLHGWQNIAKFAGFDVIVATAAYHQVPQNILESLNIGGRAFFITGETPAMQATITTRVNDNEWRADHLFETDTAYTPHATPTKDFTF